MRNDLHIENVDTWTDEQLRFNAYKNQLNLQNCDGVPLPHVLTYLRDLLVINTELVERLYARDREADCSEAGTGVESAQPGSADPTNNAG